MTAVVETIAPRLDDVAAPYRPHKPLRRLIWGPTAFAGTIVLLFFGFFGGWAALAPLSSGAVAHGLVGPVSNRRVVQHFEGGIIKEVHVREGQQVLAGEILMTLESTGAAATLSASREEWLRLLVIRARLEAQTLNLTEILLPDEFTSAATPELVEFAANQKRLFQIRLTTLVQQREIFQRQIEQSESEITSIQAETAGMRRQMSLIVEEIEDKSKLLEQQLVVRSGVLALQRDHARLESGIRANEARIAQSNQRIEEIKLSLLQSNEAFQDQVAQEGTAANNRIAQLEESMEATADVLRRTEILSPVNGIVLGLRHQTLGGVILPGEPIMDIVPSGDDLIVLAKVLPQDIDAVRVGHQARLTLLPFASRNMLPLLGEVIQVAADASTDERSGGLYYEVRIKLSTTEIAKQDGVYLTPGMPADVTIVTGERTLLQYVVEPLMRSIRTAFVSSY